MTVHVPDWPLFLLAGGFGLAIGSFLNVVIYRGPSSWGLVEPDFPRGNLAAPGSYCPACRAPIPPWRLIPVVSYLAQRGQCAACKARISPRYPIVEMIGAAAAVAALASFGLTPAAICASIYLFALIALGFIDLDTGYLPDAITLPLLAGGLIGNAFGLIIPFGDAAIGAASGYLAFRAIGFLFEKIRRKDGLGQGDAKILAAIGAWCGWSVLPAVVFGGALMTLIALAILRIFKTGVRLDQPIPFGPGLCAAGAAAIFFARYFQF